MKLEGKSIDLAIDEEGEIEEIEKEIEVEDLPRAVIKAARKAFPEARIAKVEEVSTRTTSSSTSWKSSPRTERRSKWS